jgi:hypothetical protein
MSTNLNERELPKVRSWTLGKASEYLIEQGYDIPTSTLRGWFNELHRLKIHSLERSDRKDRVLYDTEIQIAKYIHDAKKQYGSQISMKTVGTEIANKFNVFHNELDNEETFQLQVFDEEKIKEFFKEEVTTQLQEMQKSFEKKFALLSDPIAEARKTREIYNDMRFTELRLRQELKREAIDQWAKNPVKSSILFWKENSEKKNEYITSYVEEHIVERLKNESVINNESKIE